jgi:SAM-dependent methyltransferase
MGRCPPDSIRSAMSTYQHLSALYDTFMQDAPYDDWDTWLRDHLDLSNLHVADVGCGTGKLTRALAPACKTILGVDVSEEMLAQASKQALAERMQIQWMCQDMRQLRFPRQVDVVISTCDCVNYLRTIDDVRVSFQHIHHQLSSQGWFCFDVLGPERLRVLENGFWYDLQDDAAVLFETSVEVMSAEQRTITYEVHAFVSEDGQSYGRVEEQHEQVFYERVLLEELLRKTGFEVNTVLGDFGRASLEDADRWVFITRKTT